MGVLYGFDIVPVTAYLKRNNSALFQTSLYTDIVLFSFLLFSKTSASAREQARSARKKNIFFFPHHYPLALVVNKSPATRAIIGLMALACSLYFITRVQPSSETQGEKVGSVEKAGRKFSSTGQGAPGYRLSPNYFQKFKRMPAPDWAQKMLCIIVPNRRTVSPEFFS